MKLLTRLEEAINQKAIEVIGIHKCSCVPQTTDLDNHTLECSHARSVWNEKYDKVCNGMIRALVAFALRNSSP